jgi:hypothetical protein
MMLENPLMIHVDGSWKEISIALLIYWLDSMVNSSLKAPYSNSEHLRKYPAKML